MIHGFKILRFPIIKVSEFEGFGVSGLNVSRF
jgi:hypothetical protein